MGTTRPLNRHWIASGPGAAARREYSRATRRRGPRRRPAAADLGPRAAGAGRLSPGSAPDGGAGWRAHLAGNCPHWRTRALAHWHPGAKDLRAPADDSVAARTALRPLPAQRAKAISPNVSRRGGEIGAVRACRRAMSTWAWALATATPWASLDARSAPSRRDQPARASGCGASCGGLVSQQRRGRQAACPAGVLARYSSARPAPTV
jgi:hypothetical protein